ncbi:MarR family winged helix-turn-helix transcriptional regulator [Saccharospirillum impatiens]|uniref:MarR family winged helix-turn-helix transcriptional regulator n=1 Tax=Saccharospirillum impatiens TaxID=169438 RepID=UPI0004917B41|nr:MarR family transcriptional regulator [Saccharospirillum impatiens]
MTETTQKIDATLLNSLVGYRLRRAQLAYFENFTATCTEQGVTPGLFGILCVVRDNPGLTQTAVAKAIDTDRSAMVSAVDKLEKQRLIERRQSDSDRRSYALFLTEDGIHFTENLHKKVLAHEAHFEQVMNKGEKEWLLGMLERIIDLDHPDG